MASKVSKITDPIHDTFQGLWKLNDSVKIRISTENFKPMKYGAEFEQMQETKVYSYIAYYIVCMHIAIRYIVK